MLASHKIIFKGISPYFFETTNKIISHQDYRNYSTNLDMFFEGIELYFTTISHILCIDA